jgi:hypothetical protein
MGSTWPACAGSDERSADSDLGVSKPRGHDFKIPLHQVIAGTYKKRSISTID